METLLPPAASRVREIPNLTSGLIERTEHGLTILSPAHGRPIRRVLYVNSYGGGAYWQQIKRGLIAPHHLWGCLELVQRGYEVALAEPLPDFYLHRNPLPHDLRLLRVVRSWLGRDGIVYCGHNVLYWIPLLRALGALRCRVVSLLFAREPLDQSRAHSGIVALTGAAAEQARKLAPRAKVAQLAWGADLRLYPDLPYEPDFFLSCGRTLRDHPTLCAAAHLTSSPLRVIAPRLASNLTWPGNVRVFSGPADDALPYGELLHDQYAACAASLIILKSDPAEYTAVGMTNVIEAMAMSRPVIVTRTGALPTEIDVEKAGCGLHVPPNDAPALARAIETLAADPQRAAAMGRAGRIQARQRYNIERYATDLHHFFESL
ncbi:MAG: glycosyltransferase family 4 protein [Verrucomicrobiota bacterium]